MGVRRKNAFASPARVWIGDANNGRTIDAAWQIALFETSSPEDFAFRSVRFAHSVAGSSSKASTPAASAPRSLPTVVTESNRRELILQLEPTDPESDGTLRTTRLGKPDNQQP